MNDNVPEGARTSPASARNRQPILEVLRPRVADGARVLEVASGAGEHAMFLAAALLFMMTFLVNTIAEVVRQRLRERYRAM